MKWSTKKSFTLIEMLIVIVIIGILAAALVPRLQSIQGRARDTKRKTDLLTIYNANEIHKIDNSVYANFYVYSSMYSATTPLTGWITGLATILTSVPRDPINNFTSLSTGHYTYFYAYWVTGASYELYAVLENMVDPARCELKLYNYAHPVYPVDGLSRCPTGAYPVSRYRYFYDPLNIRRH